jgi:hypothetical protein
MHTRGSASVAIVGQGIAVSPDATWELDIPTEPV